MQQVQQDVSVVQDVQVQQQQHVVATQDDYDNYNMWVWN